MGQLRLHRPWPLGGPKSFTRCYANDKGNLTCVKSAPSWFPREQDVMLTNNSVATLATEFPRTGTGIITTAAASLPTETHTRVAARDANDAKECILASCNK